MLRFVALLLLSFALLAPNLAHGQELDPRAMALYRELKCPVCQTSLEASETQIAHDMKKVIRDKLAAGESPDQIKAYFLDRYGEAILVAPPKTSETILAGLSQ